ncbi:MAG: hypothetical protein LBS19_15700 [Clostridiales bacterium]|jgi:hypothetical protein|nr:hypothetical protein [Clostridiales bacterium]
MKFIEADSEEALDMLDKEHPSMRSPANKLLELNKDKHARMLIEAREKELRDNAARIKGARLEGERTGEQRVKKIGEQLGRLEVSKNLLHEFVSIEEATQLTELPLEQIQEIAEKLWFSANRGAGTVTTPAPRASLSLLQYQPRHICISHHVKHLRLIGEGFLSSAAE